MNKFEYQKALRGAGLTPQQYMVLMTLQTYANADGTKAHPGWDKLRVDTGLDPRTIKSAVKVLEARGFLVCTERRAVRGSANVYSLTLPSAASSTASPGYSPPSSPGYTQSPSEAAESRGGSPETVPPGHPQDDPWALPDKSHDPGLTDPWGTSVVSRGTSVAPQGVHPMPPHQIPSPDPEHHERHAPDLHRGADDSNWQHDLEPLSSTWKPWPGQLDRIAREGLDADEVLEDFIGMHSCECKRAPKSRNWGAKFTAYINDPDHFAEKDHRDFHDPRYGCPPCGVQLWWDMTCPNCKRQYKQPTNQGA